MARRRADEDDEDDLPKDPSALRLPERWDNEDTAREVRAILEALEAPPVDDAARLALQKHVFRSEWLRKMGFKSEDGRQHVTLLVRTIIESEGNQDALIEPIVSAVSSCMRKEWTDRGLQWIAAFDKIKLTEILATMRSLDLFSEKSLVRYLGMALDNKLRRILDPPAEPSIPRAELIAADKARLRAAALAVTAKNIELGRNLLGLRSRFPGNAKFGREREKLFPDVSNQDAANAMRVAKLYDERPEIYRVTKWPVLLALSSRLLPAAKREAIERKLLRGEKICAKEVKQAWVHNRIGTGLRTAA